MMLFGGAQNRELLWRVLCKTGLAGAGAGECRLLRARFEDHVDRFCLAGAGDGEEKEEVCDLYALTRLRARNIEVLEQFLRLQPKHVRFAEEEEEEEQQRGQGKGQGKGQGEWGHGGGEGGEVEVEGRAPLKREAARDMQVEFDELQKVYEAASRAPQPPTHAPVAEANEEGPLGDIDAALARRIREREEQLTGR